MWRVAPSALGGTTGHLLPSPTAGQEKGDYVVFGKLADRVVDSGHPPSWRSGLGTETNSDGDYAEEILGHMTRDMIRPDLGEPHIFLAVPWKNTSPSVGTQRMAANPPLPHSLAAFAKSLARICSWYLGSDG